MTPVQINNHYDKEVQKLEDSRRIALALHNHFDTADVKSQTDNSRHAFDELWKNKDRTK